MARNGETALIQVGDEVPVLTPSNWAPRPLQGATAGLLRTYQYRSTGVILKIKPVIHSGDQIDLDLSQEVSQPDASDGRQYDAPRSLLARWKQS